MKTKLLTILVLLTLLISLLPISVFAAAPGEFTIDVRNRTGSSVEFNYRGSDGILHWVSVPVGVSSLTLVEDVYSYWADPNCGHIAGNINVNQQRQILWITCGSTLPVVVLTRPHKANPCEDWGVYGVGDGWVLFASITFWIGGMTPTTWVNGLDISSSYEGCYDPNAITLGEYYTAPD